MFVSDTDFFIAEITAGIFCPVVTAELPGAGAGIATADLTVMTIGTTTFDRALLVFQSRHQGVAGVHPDLREGTLFDIADGVFPPHGVGVDIAEIIDI
jgi:hypothetical protein